MALAGAVGEVATAIEDYFNFKETLSPPPAPAPQPLPPPPEPLLPSPEPLPPVPTQPVDPEGVLASEGVLATGGVLAGLGRLLVETEELM